MKKILPFLFVVLLAAGCSKKGPVVANVGSQKINIGMIKERIQDAPPIYQNYLNTQAGRKQFFDIMLRERIVIESAVKSGVKSTKEYKQALSEFKKDQQRKLKDYQENLLMELYVRELHDKELAVKDEDVMAYYEEHKKEYQKPVEIVARHILFMSEQDAKAGLARVKKGEDFAKLAKELSGDPISAMRGGEIGPFKRGDLVPEFEKAVFPLNRGQVSGIVKTQFGYHIIKKISEKTLPAMSMDEAKFEIRKVLEKSRFDAWLERARKNLNVKVDYDALSALQAQKPAGAQGAEPGSQPAAVE
ncbi:MAG: peptidylprolyl isomerase [Endomicrobiales bacterium]|nr:peptidylprolyl isomerase [Endomicrobiales bacterium]